MFKLEEFTEARVTGVTNRTEKHGDEDVPAVTIAVEIEAANTLLDCIDPSIRQALYKAVDDQPTLEGVETSTPVLRCNAFDVITLTTAHEGWRLYVDDGIDETTPMEFKRVKVDKLRVDAKQGGTIVLKLRLGTSDVDADKLGKLGMHNGQSIWLKLLPPLPVEPAIDGSTGAFEADHPGGETAGDLFADMAGLMGDGREAPYYPKASDGHTGEDLDDETPEPDPVATDAAEFEAGAAQAVENARRGRRGVAME